MTPHQFRIGRTILSLAFAALGVWSLADADYVKGAFWLVIAVVWLLMAAYEWPQPRDLKARDNA